MPDPYERKHREKSLVRIREKYLECPNERNPYHMYAPLKEETETLKALMNTKNYVRIMTQIDLNLFIVQNHYLYCDNDLWVCGEALVFNCNPDKTILVQPICSKAKKECICYSEHSNQFLTVCPSCKKVSIAIKDTAFSCKSCKFTIPYNKTNNLPYAKLSCDLCPKEIGWEKVQKIKSIIFQRLVPRQHMVSQAIKDDIDSFEKEVLGDG